MKSAFAFALVLVLIVFLLAETGLSQNPSHFTSVGGEYGRNVIGTIKADDNATAGGAAEEQESQNKSGLWSWGSSPKGTLVVDGTLIGDPRYTMKKLNVTKNWLEDTFVDPYGSGSSGYTYTDSQTGEPVQTYVDANGRSYYTYTDASTKKLVYVYFNAQTGEPTYASFTPLSGTGTADQTTESSLPPIFGRVRGILKIANG